MSKTVKWLLSISIGLNIILLTYVILEYKNKQEIKEMILFSEVYKTLEELEGTIAKQMDNHWKEPKLITKQIQETIRGFDLSVTTTQKLGLHSTEENRMMNKLYLKLNYYLNLSYDITEQSKEELEQLRQMMREVEIGNDLKRGEPPKSMREIIDTLSQLSSIIN